MAMSRLHTAMAFTGPLGLGMLRWLSPDADERAQALAEYRQLTANGTMLLNQVLFHAWSIEGAVERRDFTEAESHLADLAAALADAPDSVYGFAVPRGHLLIAWHRNPTDPALPAALRSLLDYATRMSITSPRLPPDLLALASR
jgi:hypothetical protein